MAILNEHGHPVSSAQMRVLLGLRPGGHLPPEGMDPVTVQGYTVRVLPEVQGRARVRGANPHRVMVKCVSCPREVPAGRLAQHERSCTPVKVGQYYTVNSALTVSQELFEDGYRVRASPENDMILGAMSVYGVWRSQDKR